MNSNNSVLVKDLFIKMECWGVTILFIVLLPIKVIRTFELAKSIYTDMGYILLPVKTMMNRINFQRIHNVPYLYFEKRTRKLFSNEITSGKRYT